jgi:hypothetical protein
MILHNISWKSIPNKNKTLLSLVLKDSKYKQEKSYYN